MGIVSVGARVLGGLIAAHFIIQFCIAWSTRWAASEKACRRDRGYCAISAPEAIKADGMEDVCLMSGEVCRTSTMGMAFADAYYMCTSGAWHVVSSGGVVFYAVLGGAIAVLVLYGLLRQSIIASQQAVLPLSAYSCVASPPYVPPKNLRQLHTHPV